MDWNSYIENDGVVTLPEGDYDFKVTGFERAEHPGSAKIPACPKAVIELTCTVDGVGTSIVKDNLYLDEGVEWKLCEFFRAVGLRKHGERSKMPWDKVVGSKGRAHLIVNRYTGNDGVERENNRVANYIDPETTEGALPWE